MEIQEFDYQMQRICGVFGKKNFDPVRTEVIWNYVRELPYAQFIAVAEHFIGSFRKVPTPADFREAAVSQRRNNTGALIGLDAEILCHRCKDTGTIQAWRMGLKYKHNSTYSFKCPTNCDASKKLAHQIPYWGPKFEKDFFPCFGTNETTHDIWAKRHLEFYGFDEADRKPKVRSEVNHDLQNTVTAALGALKDGPVELFDPEEVDVVPF